MPPPRYTVMGIVMRSGATGGLRNLGHKVVVDQPATWAWMPAEVPGDSPARAKANQVRPPTLSAVPDIAVLDRYLGRYRIPSGPIIEVPRDGARLAFKVGDDEGELLLQDEANFYLLAFNVWITLQRDDSDKVARPQLRWPWCLRGHAPGLTACQNGDLHEKANLVDCCLDCCHFARRIRCAALRRAIPHPTGHRSII